MSFRRLESRTDRDDAFPHVAFHSVTPEDVDDEISNQLDEATLFGESGLSLGPRSRRRGSTQDPRVNNLSAAIVTAANAHKSAHDTHDRAEGRLKLLLKVEATARTNIVLGGSGKADQKVDDTLASQQSIVDAAKQVVHQTNDALPVRLQGHHLS